MIEWRVFVCVLLFTLRGRWQLASCHSRVFNASALLAFLATPFIQHIISFDVNNLTDDCHLSFVLNDTKNHRTEHVHPRKLSANKFEWSDEKFIYEWLYPRYDKWDVHWRQRRQPFFLVGVAIFHIMLNEKGNAVSKKEEHFSSLTRNDKQNL